MLLPTPAPVPDPAPSRARVRLAPSMMCADFLDLRTELARFTGAGVEWLHQDVMDGHYVPNLTLGPDLCRAMAAACPIAQDVHLMVEEPERWVEHFAGLPGLRLTFHPEATRHAPAVIDRIRAAGASPGIAVAPAVALEAVAHLFPLVDQVTVMTVNPGFAGQRLLEWCLPRLRQVRDWADAHRPGLDVEVDGNVSWSNIPRMIEAGASVLVLGTSSLFQKGLARDAALARVRAMADGA